MSFNNETVTLLSIIITLIISSNSLYLTLKSTKKTLYINSVTANRVKWIGDIRDNISKFCGLTYHYALTELSKSEKQKIFQEIDQVRFLIKLQLNREDEFDKRIIEKIDIIPNIDTKKIDVLESEINELINLTQDLLKLEWEGVKMESMKGILTNKEKEKLYEKYLKMKK